MNERVPEIWRHFTDEDVRNSGAESPYGAVVKGTLKSMCWYDLDALEGRFRTDWTLNDLKAFTLDWANEESDQGPAAEAALRIPIGDRWPLTDLFELLLATSGRRDVDVAMLQGHADWNDPEVVDAVDGALHVAIRRRDNGRWEPPGGVLELGEVLHDGLRREVFEETGLKVEPDALTGIYQNLPRGIVAFVFRCHAVGGQLAPSDEASKVAWLTPDEITDRMDQAYAVRLLDALTHNSRQPHLRQHDGVHLL